MAEAKELPDSAKLAIELVSKWSTEFAQGAAKQLSKKSRLRWNGDSSPPENWLGSPPLVGQLVANFVIGCIKRHPDMDVRTLNAEDSKEALRLGEIFVGRPSPYIPVEGWNEAGKIDRFISRQMKGGHLKPEGTVSELFNFSVFQVFQFAAMPKVQAAMPIEIFIKRGLEFATGLLIGICEAPQKD